MNSCLGPGPKLLGKSNPSYGTARLGRSEETVAGELLYGGRRRDWDRYHEASRLLKVMQLAGIPTVEMEDQDSDTKHLC